MAPPVQPINLFEFEDAAKELLPKQEYDYIAGGATDESALTATGVLMHRGRLGRGCCATSVSSTCRPRFWEAESSCRC